MTKKFRTDELILLAATLLAERLGFVSFTRDDVARETGLSQGRISAYGDGGGIATLRAAVMTAALLQPNLKILAQGLTTGDRVALAAPESLRARALASVLAQ